MLAPPLAAAGINASSQKSVATSLESLAEALEPFKEMSTEQWADLAKVAQEYRESGQLPDWVLARQPKATRSKNPKASKPSKVDPAEVVVKLRDLQDRSSGMEPAAINQEIQALASLTGPDLKLVQKEFLGAAIGKNKGEQLAAIQKKIQEFRTSRDRSAGILAR